MNPATRKILLALAALTPMIAGVVVAAEGKPAKTPPATARLVVPADAETLGNAALYEAVLALLRSSDEVIVPRPDVHPVSATNNREAIIPPMCYTRTEGKHNPCYVCHQDAQPGRENRMNDADLQSAYSFSDVGLENHWSNLFEDRSARVAAIGDDEILDWVGRDNYSELPERLRAVGFQGWIPDMAGLQKGAGAFDEFGFAKDGSHWVAFNYKPFPSTFWPTNGSTDDVMIRLPSVYRSDRQGRYSRDIYLANLSIVEANIKGLDEIETPLLDEKVVGEDLDGDGQLGQSRRLRLRGHYVGGAHEYFFQAGIYPQGTEFLHTVRYLAFADDGRVVPSTRMKEVRYLRKWQAMPKQTLGELYAEEGYSKDSGYLPGYTNLWDWGLDNGMGWSVLGFIENRNGRLRAANYEETLFCMGCHNSIGATVDKTFSFARKVDGAAGWGYIDYQGMPDVPNRGESAGEYATYFERAGGGDEFRSNPEMRERWFKPDGRVDHERLKGKDVYDIIAPSRERALQLNKAYRVIVEDQDYIFGRDASIVPPHNVYERVDNESSPTLPPDRVYEWDIRLDWSAAAAE